MHTGRWGWVYINRSALLDTQEIKKKVPMVLQIQPA